MPDYRRAYVPGGTYFFTVVTRDRRPLFRDPQRVERLRLAFRHVREKHPFRIDGAVVLPDHIHCLWTLPHGDQDFSLRWRLIKHRVTVGERRPGTLRSGVWQDRFWEHVIRDDKDRERHLDYIHYNPVKHGLADSPAGWPHSSFHRAVDRGWYPKAWGEAEPASILGMDLE